MRNRKNIHRQTSQTLSMYLTMNRFASIASFALIALSICATAQAQEGPAYRHLVLFEFKENTTEHGYMEVIGDFMELQNQIDSLDTIEWGFIEPGTTLQGNYTHAFLVTFSTADGIKSYRNHPAHLKFEKVVKKRVKEITVIDYSVME